MGDITLFSPSSSFSLSLFLKRLTSENLFSFFFYFLLLRRRDTFETNTRARRRLPLQFLPLLLLVSFSPLQLQLLLTSSSTPASSSASFRFFCFCSKEEQVDFVALSRERRWDSKASKRAEGVGLLFQHPAPVSVGVSALGWAGTRRDAPPTSTTGGD